jgi:hypothetical protein
MSDVSRVLAEGLAQRPKGGRPTEYSLELATRICEQLGQGKLLCEIASEDWMPHAATIYRWLHTHPEFKPMYDAALMARFDLYCEELKSIAKGEPGDVIDTSDEEDEEGNATVTIREGKTESIQRAKLRIETLKWIMGKRLPQVYADQPTVVVAPTQAAVTQEKRPIFEWMEAYRQQKALGLA